jgi:hypothetical protein
MTISNSKNSEPRNHYLEGVNAIISILNSETISIKEKAFVEMKRGRTLSTDIGLMNRHLDKYTATSASTKNADRSETDDPVAEALDLGITGYAAILSATTVILRDPKTSEGPNGGFTRGDLLESFTNAVKKIDAISMENIIKAVDLLDVDNNTVFARWSEERGRDGFGFNAVIASFKEALDAAAKDPKDATLWMERLADLADTTRNILRVNVGWALKCISVCDKAEVSLNLETSAIEEISSLTKSYPAESAKRLERKVPEAKPIKRPKKVEPEKWDDVQRHIFSGNMQRGMALLRTEIFAEAARKEDDAYAMFGTTNNIEIKELDALKVSVAKLRNVFNSGQTEPDLSEVLANPEKNNLLIDALNKTTQTYAMYYTERLYSWSSVDASRLNERMRIGVEDLKLVVLPKTIENISGVIKYLNGKVPETELSEIVDWFGKGVDKLDFKERKKAAEAMLSTKNSNDMIRSALGIMINDISTHVVSLVASSNLAAGRNNAALQELIMFKELNIKIEKVYSDYNKTRAFEWYKNHEGPTDVQQN